MSVFMMVSSRLAGFICGFDLKKGGDAPQAKSLSAPIQIVLCAFDCFALFVITQENPFQPRPIDYWPPPAAWILLVPVGH